MPGGRDQDVGRLEVAVHDQVGVRMADRFADLAEQVQARGDVELAAAAVVGERLAFHVLQRQVGLAVAIDTCVQQAGDERMGEARQDFTLAVEALAQARVGQAGAQQFQRDLAFVQAVRACSQPDLAHAAFADQPFQLVRPDLGTGVGAGRKLDHGLAQEGRVVCLHREQLRELVRKRGILAAQCGQVILTLAGRQLEQGIEQG